MDNLLYDHISEKRAMTLDSLGNHRHFRTIYLVKPDTKIIVTYLLQVAGLPDI
jgi:hypothetical protein